jgi:quinol monooxygenase YgiN
VKIEGIGPHLTSLDVVIIVQGIPEDQTLRSIYFIWEILVRDCGMNDIVSWMLEVSIKPGQLDTFKTLAEDLVQSTRTEPGTLAYEWFLSEDNRSCHIYERYADSAAAMTHLGTFGEKFADRFMPLLDLQRLAVYGAPSDEVKGVLGGFGANFLGQLNGFAR